jgi:hypothetical protein
VARKTLPSPVLTSENEQDKIIAENSAELDALLAELVRPTNFDNQILQMPSSGAGKTAWQIAVSNGAQDWYKAFSPEEETGGWGFEQTAVDMGFDDPASLFLAAIATFGRSPSFTQDAESLRGFMGSQEFRDFAESFASRKSGQSLNEWWTKFTGRKGGEPSPISGALTFPGSPPNSLARITNAKFKGAYTPKTVKDRPSDDENPVYSRYLDAIIEVGGQRVWTFLDRLSKDSKIGKNNLLATLYALGWTPNRIRTDFKDPDNKGEKLRAVAIALQEYTSGDLGDFIDGLQWEKAAKRKSVDVFLEGITEGISFPVSQEWIEGQLEEDDPVVVDEDGEPLWYNNQPLRESGFQVKLNKKATLTSFYRGDNPTRGEVIRWLRDGLSDYQIAKELTKDMGTFLRSDAWKTNRQEYVTVFNSTIGGWKSLPQKRKASHQKLMRKAVLYQWSPAAYKDALSQTNAYLGGSEFRNDVGTLEGAYARVMGGPITDNVRRVVKEAALSGINEAGFKSWLRSQPEYGSSIEMQGRMNRLSFALADMTGSVPKRVKGIVPNPPASFAIPDDPRLGGLPELTPGGGQRVQAGLEEN